MKRFMQSILVRDDKDPKILRIKRYTPMPYLPCELWNNIFEYCSSLSLVNLCATSKYLKSLVMNNTELLSLHVGFSESHDNPGTSMYLYIRDTYNFTPEERLYLLHMICSHGCDGCRDCYISRLQIEQGMSNSWFRLIKKFGLYTRTNENTMEAHRKRCMSCNDKFCVTNKLEHDKDECRNCRISYRPISSWVFDENGNQV
jgi:F-box domain